jgi:hypothetical protein
MQCRVGSFKNLLTNHKARKAQIYTKASRNTANSSCTNHGPGGWVEPGWRKPFLHVFILEKNLLSSTSCPISVKHGTNHPQVKGIQNCKIKG